MFDIYSVSFEILVTSLGLTVNNSYHMYMEPAPEDYFGIPIVFDDGRGLAPVCLIQNCESRRIWVELVEGQEYSFSIIEEPDNTHRFDWVYHPADINMDGEVNFFDISTFLQRMYDYNMDETINFQDVKDLVINYGL